MTKKTQFQQVGDLFSKFQLEDKGGYITQEFQDFGMRLAHELDDLKHKSLYIKMAKKEDRGVLERALSFVTDANARSKPKLFMWKLKELKQELQSNPKLATLKPEKPEVLEKAIKPEK